MAPIFPTEIDTGTGPEVNDQNDGSIQEKVLKELFGPPSTHGHNNVYLDSSITFENYHWWANRARENEKHIPANAGITGLLQMVSGRSPKGGPAVPTEKGKTEHNVDTNRVEGNDRAKDGQVKTTLTAQDGTPIKRHSLTQYGVSEEEWETAQRAARTASWGAIFYLITTDVLGPFVIPWAFAQLGYGPSIGLFLVFGILAYYSSVQLWQMFIGLDSPRYPVRTYGDLGFRLYGGWARVLCLILQNFQFFLNVCLCIVANGQGLAQMAVGLNNKGFLCFVVAELIFTLVGFLLGQIRTLQRLSWLANLSVWLNVINIFATIAAVFIYAPNYAANANFGITGPIVKSAGLPPGKSLADNVNGMMNGVFAYGGATMFCELMGEMRRPMDFWKAVSIGYGFITLCYMVFGLVVYSQQGNYSFNPAFQGISQAGYHLQTLGNALYFIVSVIAALLYGNIGIKVFYTAILEDVFRFPPLTSKKGKWTWVGLVPFYWGLAFILAAAVPQITNLTAFEGALTIMQFSYTFPPILMVAYNCQKDSVLPGDEFDPRTGNTKRMDGGPKRWWRGFKKQLLLNTWNSLYFLAALATAILGLWAAISGMVSAYATTTISSFTCANPAGD